MALIRNNDGLKTSRYSIKTARKGGASPRPGDASAASCANGACRRVHAQTVRTARDAGLVLSAFCTLDFLLAGVQVFHTDRGDEFDNTRIDELLDVFDIKGSLPRKGNPYDNAVAESTNRPLKKELVYRTATPRSSN